MEYDKNKTQVKFVAVIFIISTDMVFEIDNLTLQFQAQIIKRKTEQAANRKRSIKRITVQVTEMMNRKKIRVNTNKRVVR